LKEHRDFVSKAETKHEYESSCSFNSVERLKSMLVIDFTISRHVYN